MKYKYIKLSLSWTHLPRTKCLLFCRNFKILLIIFFSLLILTLLKSAADSIKIKSPLCQIIACHPTGDKPLPDTILSSTIVLIFHIIDFRSRLWNTGVKPTINWSLLAWSMKAIRHQSRLLSLMIKPVRLPCCMMFGSWIFILTSEKRGHWKEWSH